MPIIRVEQLHYAYPPVLPGQEPVEVLRGVDLSIERGEFVALMGPTGAGKSTLCLALNGLVPQATGGVIRGRVEVLGRSTRTTPVAILASQVGLVMQDPESQLFSATVETEVAFGPENLGLPPQQIAERVAWALNLVGMADYRQRTPTQLSGGQKQRVAIAASLAMLPEVLLLDEPTSGLDPVGQAEVLAVIDQLRRDRRMTILLVSQDAERVAEFADRVAILDEGRIVVEGAPEAVFSQRALLEAAGLAAPQVSQVAEELNRRHGAAHHWTRLDEAETGLRAATASPSPHPCRRTLSRDAGEGRRVCEGGVRADGKSALRVETLHYHYDSEIPALNGIDLAVPEGAFLGIVGQNGSGKTTLAKHFNGLLRPTRGRVWILGRDTAGLAVGELARSVGYVFQNPDHMIFGYTTKDEIAFGPHNLGLAPAEVRARTAEALALWHLEPYADLPPATLGFGLRRLVSVAAVYAMRPQVLVLDEPTAGLDARSAHALMALLTDLRVHGHTIVLITHDMQLVAEYCSAMLVMHAGRALTYGPTRQVMVQADALARAQVAPPQVTLLAQRLGDLGLPPDCLTVAEFCDAYGRATRGAP